MAITTLEKYKAVKGVTDTTYDTSITALIPLVEDWIKGYTNNYIVDAVTEAVTFPNGFELAAINMIEYNLKTTTGKLNESLGDYSTAFVVDYPKSVLRGLKVKARVF